MKTFIRELISELLYILFITQSTSLVLVPKVLKISLSGMKLSVVKNVEEVVFSLPYENPPYFPMDVPSLAKDALFSTHLALIDNHKRLQINLDSHILTSTKYCMIWLILYAKGMVSDSQKTVRIIFNNAEYIALAEWTLKRLFETAEQDEIWKFEHIRINALHQIPVTREDSAVICYNLDNYYQPYNYAKRMLQDFQAVALQTAFHSGGLPLILVNPRLRHSFLDTHLPYYSHRRPNLHQNINLDKVGRKYQRNFAMPMILRDFLVVYELNDDILPYKLPTGGEKQQHQRFGYVRRYKDTLDIYHFFDRLELMKDGDSDYYYDFIVANHYRCESLVFDRQPGEDDKEDDNNKNSSYNSDDIISYIHAFINEHPDFLTNIVLRYATVEEEDEILRQKRITKTVSNNSSSVDGDESKRRKKGGGGLMRRRHEQ